MTHKAAKQRKLRTLGRGDGAEEESLLPLTRVGREGVDAALPGAIDSAHGDTSHHLWENSSVHSTPQGTPATSWNSWLCYINRLRLASGTVCFVQTAWVTASMSYGEPVGNKILLRTCLSFLHYLLRGNV